MQKEKNNLHKKSSFRFIILVVFIVLSWLLGRYFNIDLDYYRNFLSRFPVIYSGIIFVFLYVTISFFVWIAKDIFKIIGAILFGAVLSSLFIFIAEMINVSILFNLSKFLGRDFVKKILKGNLKAFDDKIYLSGFWGIFILRVIPLVPYRFLDIVTGLTKVSFSQYFLAAALGSPLRIFWIQFILTAVGENVFKDPKFIVEYFYQHQIVLVLSFLYAIASIILAIFIKKSLKLSK